MRVAVLLVCMALLVAVKAVVRGFGLLVFLRITWDACCVVWSALKFSASWIVPHWFNHAMFWAAGYCIWLVFEALNNALYFWEYVFDLVMLQIGQQPSAEGAQLVDHLLRSSGVRALVHIICQQFILVPQAIAEFCSPYDNIPNVVFVVAVVASLHPSVAIKIDSAISQSLCII